MRPASLAQLGGFRPPEHPLASWAGTVGVALPGECWPACNGQPLLGLAQINLAEVPYVPPVLEGLALITVFLDYEDIPRGPNGSGWELRAYERLDDLVALEERVRARDAKQAKDTPLTLRAKPVRWEQIDDDEDAPADGLKLGGWPTEIQDVDVLPGAEYAFQVDSDEGIGFNLIDSGVLYVGRRGEDWVAEAQFY